MVEFNCSRDVVVGLEEFRASRAERLGIKNGRETKHVVQWARWRRSWHCRFDAETEIWLSVWVELSRDFIYVYRVSHSVEVIKGAEEYRWPQTTTQYTE